MGGELGQSAEWNHRESVPWHLADEHRRAGLMALIKDLNRLYRTTAALHRRDHEADGFSWLSWEDEHNSVLSYVRHDGDDHVVVVLNFTPVPRDDYRIGVPRAGRYRTLLNSDSTFYGGSNLGNSIAVSEPSPAWGAHSRSSSRCRRSARSSSRPVSLGHPGRGCGGNGADGEFLAARHRGRVREVGRSGSDTLARADR